MVLALRHGPLFAALMSPFVATLSVAQPAQSPDAPHHTAVRSFPPNPAELNAECETAQGNLLRRALAQSSGAGDDELREQRWALLRQLEEQESACRTAMATPEGAARWKAEQARLLAKGKAELGERIARAQAEARLRPPPPPELGIVDPIEATIIGPGFETPVNTWQGYVDGVLTSVTGSAYGQSHGDKKGLGVIEVVRAVPNSAFDSGWQEVFSHSYDAPANTGFLTVVSEFVWGCQSERRKVRTHCEL